MAEKQQEWRAVDGALFFKHYGAYGANNKSGARCYCKA